MLDLVGRLSPFRLAATRVDSFATSNLHGKKRTIALPLLTTIQSSLVIDGCSITSLDGFPNLNQTTTIDISVWSFLWSPHTACEHSWSFCSRAQQTPISSFIGFAINGFISPVSRISLTNATGSALIPECQSSSPANFIASPTFVPTSVSNLVFKVPTR